MKQFRLITAMLLALILTFAPLMQVSAAGQAQYISEISIGYGDDGKTALENAGYTVWADLNANEGGNGSAVWLGYKTTTDANEAVTDIALMNMKGGYSFDAYTQEIESLNRQVSEQLASFKTSIEEFRTNYAQGNIFAKQALVLMNAFTDDETVDENGNPKGIGDIFLDEATSDETMHRIFLEGNSEAIASIETALSYACIETGEDNVLTRIENSEYPETLDPQKNEARSALKRVFADFRSDAISAQTAHTQIAEFEGGTNAFFTQELLSDEELASYALQESKYVILSETPFGNTGMSLLDFALLDDEAKNENGEVLEDEYLEMLAQSMTDGQLGIVANVGILPVLVNAVAGKNAAEAEEGFAQVEKVAEPVSVYYGVDRSLFEDIDSIALTSKALRDKAAAEGSEFGKDANADISLRDKLTLASAITFGCGAIIFGCSIKPALTLVEEYEWLGYDAEDSILGCPSYETVYVTNTAAVVSTVIGCIAIVAAVVLTIFAILEWVKKPTVPNTKYTEIPRVIVEKSETDGSFIPYYAAKLAGAAEGETDSTKLYGDLNALNTIDQWLAVYYAKDPTLGRPLTAEMLKTTNATLSASEAEQYAAIHMFGSTSAANLNQYNTKDGAKAIYVFLRTSASEVAQSGTIFTKSSVIMSVVTLLAGAAIATAVTYLVMRRKKETAAA